ncbi:GNAT family N-acetyltransferase [Actinomycetota bacterium Odt1-20B]
MTTPTPTPAPTPTPSDAPLLHRLERYYDTVPRAAARAEDFGPLTLFVRESGGWPLYARPTLGRTGPAATPADITRVRARQRELGLPEAFEWIGEFTPGLAASARAAGLTVHAHPLMALPPSAPTPATLPSVRVITPEDPALHGALALPHLAFATPGTAVGTAGPAELTAEIMAHMNDGAVPATRERIRAGRTVLAAAVENGVVVCSGMHLPVGTVTEIVGIGTLPSARRRGFGAAVTAALVAHARASGVETVFLSAGDENVARLYGRLGFERVATALIAEAD